MWTIVNQLLSRLRGHGMEKVIDPKTHAALDYLTTGAFFMMAGYFYGRHRRACGLALTNAMMVMGVSMLTDYTGQRMGSNVARLFSFKQHRNADIMQAAVAGLGPTLLGFGNERAALPFRLQAMNEGLVVAATDWDAGGRGEFAEMIEAAA